MKHFVILLFMVFTAQSSFCQPSVTELNECDFFHYLELISENDYHNQKYNTVSKNFKLRSDLLKKLESYFLVFGKDSIAPMYLENELDPRACIQYVNEFKEFRKNYTVQDSRDSVQKCKFQDISELIIKLCDLDNPDNNTNVELYIAELSHPFVPEYLFFHLKKAYNNSNNPLNSMPQLIKNQNLQILSRRTNILDKMNYMYYENYNSKPEILKGFEMHHDNDVFTIVNQDRELTGGFKFTMITDYLKWRWIRIKNKKEDNVLAYQSISIFGNAYTPYIRYRNNYTLADSFYKFDRPFASSIGIERAKYRIFRKGLVRHKGEFQIGALGLSQGRNIQAKLHEDVSTSSQFVHGWDNQIANGGRLAIQLNHKFDFLLASNTNRYRSIFKPTLFLVDDPGKYSGCNFIGELDMKVGSIMTSIGAGFRFSTLDFLKQSGNQMILSKPHAKDEFGWKFDIGLNYRYVVHNSLLEGLGFINTFDEDPYDKTSKDKYVLAKNEIQRNMLILDFGLNLKWRKTTVFFRNTYHTLEYKPKLANVNFQDPGLTSLLNTGDIDYYNSTVIREQKSFLKKGYYGFGTVGISWIIE
jgi:hypothetical protein